MHFAKGERLATRLTAEPVTSCDVPRRGEWASGCVLAVVLAAAPTMFGSEGPAAIAALCAGAGLSLFIVAIGGDPFGFASRARPVMVLAVVYGLFCLWGLVQALLPWPDAGGTWAAAARILGEPLAGRISRSPNETLGSVVRLLLYGTMFLVALGLGGRRRCANMLLFAIAVATLLVGLYGFTAWASGGTHVLWAEKPAYRGYLTGTFVNRNTAAAYLSIGVIVWTAIAGERLRMAHAAMNGTARHRFVRLVEALAGGAGLAFAAAAFLGLCVILSGSRAGIATMLLGLLILGFATARAGRRLALAALLAAAPAAVVAGSGATQGVGERFAREGLDGGNRLAVYGATVRAIADQPVTGTGLGTFRLVFPAYRADAMTDWGVWDRAHSVYLETGLEAGLPMAVLFVGAVIGAGLACFGAARGSSCPLPAAASAAAVAAALGAHGLVDFSLQNPAVAVTFAALLGLGCAQTRRRPDRSPSDPAWR